MKLYQIDAFTSEPFKGNPAAVCLLDRAVDDTWAQAVAAEMNLSETAFLAPRGDGFDLRWFTPTVEVDLCGHATLASAHFLWETGTLGGDRPARFHTRSGWLTATRNGEWIELDFPTTPAEPAEPPTGLLEALGVEARFVGRNRFDYLVELESQAAVEDARPEFARLAAVEARGVIITGRARDAQFDFVSRFFAPCAGIDEDPATGSAHCTLGAFWQEQLGKTRFMAYQASKRGGVVRVEVRGERTLLAGRAVTVLRGELAA